MNTLSNNSTSTGTANTGILTLRKPLTPIKQVLARQVPPRYFVDSALIIGDQVEISYSLDGKWLDHSCELQALKNFASDSGLNDYCRDGSDHTGEHVQDSGSLDLDTYLDENLTYAVRAYLQAGKVGRYDVN